MNKNHSESRNYRRENCRAPVDWQFLCAYMQAWWATLNLSIPVKTWTWAWLS